MTGLHQLARPQRPGVARIVLPAALVVAAAAAVVLQAPGWARLPLSLAAALGVAFTAGTGRVKKDALRVVLGAVGGALVALVLLGLLLDVLPAGLSPAAWGVGVAALELVVLVAGVAFGTRTGAPVRMRTVIRLSTLGWGAAALAVLAGAVVLSARSFDATHVAPLAFSAQPHGGTTDLTVTSGTATGPYEIVLVAGRVHRVLPDRFRVGPDGAYRTTLPTPPVAVVVQLVPVGGTGAVRELILDPSAR